MRRRFLDTGPHRIYPPANVCIYCGATGDDLSDEHVIPYALGGNVILPKASCGACSKITARFEQTCTRTMMGPLRARMNLQTRRRKERPSAFDVEILDPNGSIDLAQVPALEYPSTCIGIRLDPPGLLSDQPRTGRVVGELFAKYDPHEGHGLVKPGQTVAIGKFLVEPFCQMIAKIGHAHVWAALVAAGTPPKFEDTFLPGVIVGTSSEFQHYVGGDDLPLDEPNALHQLRFNRYLFNDRKLIVSTVRLFALFGMPRYHVIACYEPGSD